MQIVQPPFADFFHFSVPRDSWPDLLDAVLTVSEQAEGYQERPGYVRFPSSSCVSDSGLIRLGILDASPVGVGSVSGQALAHLRRTGFFLPLLGAVASVPHRITSLHATVDVARDARPVLARLYRRGKAERVAFSRKAVPSRQVSWTRRASLYDQGADTGTVYLGDRKRDVWAKVYDKRNEILDRYAAGLTGDCGDLLARFDPGPLTRYELALCRHVGLTLRDVAEPAAVFWHFAGGVLLPRPEDAPVWTPAGAGFELPPRPDPEPYRQLELLLERSADVGRALTLSERLGPYGFSVLVGRLAKRAGQSLPEGLQRALAAAAAAAVAGRSPPTPAPAAFAVSP